MRREKITKSHASGVVMLIFIVLFIQGVLFFFNNINNEKIADKPAELRNDSIPRDNYILPRKVEKSAVKIPVVPKKDISVFDPNKIDKEGLVALGLSPAQAQVVINYRNKGGKFNKPEDFSKIYVISPKTYERLKKQIVISAEDHSSEVNSDNKIPDKQSKPLQLNTADTSDLIALPGIGPYYAKKIIQYREKLGGFASKDQLLDIYGIDRERLDLFSERIIVDTNFIKKQEFRELSYEQLSVNPYFGAYIARAIMRFREKNGSEMTNLSNLVMNNIIKKELYKILKFYFK